MSRVRRIEGTVKELTEWLSSPGPKDSVELQEWLELVEEMEEDKEHMLEKATEKDEAKKTYGPRMCKKVLDLCAQLDELLLQLQEAQQHVAPVVRRAVPAEEAPCAQPAPAQASWGLEQLQHRLSLAEASDKKLAAAQAELVIPAPTKPKKKRSKSKTPSPQPKKTDEVTRKTSQDSAEVHSTQAASPVAASPKQSTPAQPVTAATPPKQSPPAQLTASTLPKHPPPAQPASAATQPKPSQPAEPPVSTAAPTSVSVASRTPNQAPSAAASDTKIKSPQEDLATALERMYNSQDLGKSQQALMTLKGRVETILKSPFDASARVLNMTDPAISQAIDEEGMPEALFAMGFRMRSDASAWEIKPNQEAWNVLVASKASIQQILARIEKKRQEQSQNEMKRQAEVRRQQQAQPSQPAQPAAQPTTPVNPFAMFAQPASLGQNPAQPPPFAQMMQQMMQNPQLIQGINNMFQPPPQTRQSPQQGQNPQQPPNPFLGLFSAFGQPPQPRPAGTGPAAGASPQTPPAMDLNSLVAALMQPPNAAQGNNNANNPNSTNGSNSNNPPNSNNNPPNSNNNPPPDDEEPDDYYD